LVVLQDVFKSFSTIGYDAQEGAVEGKRKHSLKTWTSLGHPNGIILMIGWPNTNPPRVAGLFGVW